MDKKLFTLAIVHKHPQVLLGLKKVRWGAGKWNGFGGRVEEGESIEMAASRELEEEVGLEARSLNKLGVLTFRYENQIPFEMHVFKARDFSGEPVETDEMKPQWFHVYEIPFKNMWQSDAWWYGAFIKDKKFEGDFTFNQDLCVTLPIFRELS